MAYKTWLLAPLLLITVHALAMDVESQDVTSQDVGMENLTVTLQVRKDIAGGSLKFHVQPNAKSRTVFSLPAGAVFQIELHPDDVQEREAKERENQGLWRKLTTADGKTAYFDDLWSDVSTLYNTSRGISLQPRPTDPAPLLVFSEVPKFSKTDCKSERVQCVVWTPEQGFIYLLNSKITRTVDGEQLYQVRFVRDEVGEPKWGKGWVLASQLEPRFDVPACEKEDCINHALFTNDPDDVQKVFQDLGLLKKPTTAIQRVDSHFYMFGRLNQPDTKGTLPYNRWLNRMDREKIPRTKRDEIAYFLRVRPLLYLGAGYSTYDFSQHGDSRPFSYKMNGPSVTGGLTFPLYLDFEALIQAVYTQSLSHSSAEVDKGLSPFEMTNDLIVTKPSHSKNLSYFFGGGLTFRSILNSDADTGYSVLYGLHAATGFFSEKWTGYANLGFTLEKIDSSFSKPEWHLALGRNFPTKLRPTAWSLWLHVAGYEALITHEDAATRLTTQNHFFSRRATIAVNYEF